MYAANILANFGGKSLLIVALFVFSLIKNF